MQRRRHTGLSMIEVLFALLIAGLVLGPLLNLLSSTNRESSSSMYEILATSYAKEIGEQLLNFNQTPGFKIICQGTGKNLGDLLQDLGNNLFAKDNTNPRRIALLGQKLYLLVSPLPLEFRERKILVEAVPLTTGTGSAKTLYYKVTIRISWSLPGEPITGESGLHQHESVIFLRQGG